MADKPPHCITNTLTSTSKRPDGTTRINQRITFEEFADNPMELTGKNFVIADKVLRGLESASKDMATAAGMPTDIPTLVEAVIASHPDAQIEKAMQEVR